MATYTYPPAGTVSVAAAPISFVLNTVETTVTEDTAAPANNLAMPTLLMIKDGLGVEHPIQQGTAYLMPTTLSDGTTVAGVTLANELKVSDAALAIAPNAAIGTNKGPMVQGSVTTAAPTYTTGQIAPLSLATTGELRVTQISGFSTETSLAKLTVAPDTALGTNTGAIVQGSVTTAAPTYTTGNVNPLSLETNGNLRVSLISGFATDTNLAKLNIAPATAIGSNTGAMVMGSVTTAAPTYLTGNIDALSLETNGNLRVSMISGFATETSLAKLTIAPSTAIGSNTGSMVMGSVTTAAPSYSTGNINPISLDTAGNIRVSDTNTLKLALSLSVGGVGARSIDDTTGVSLATPAAGYKSIRIVQNGGGDLLIFSGTTQIGALEKGGAITFGYVWSGSDVLILKNSVSGTVVTNISYNIFA
jgi:hypothetical protein